MGIKVGSVSLNYNTESPLLEQWTFLKNIWTNWKLWLIELIHVIIISKKQNCFVSWKIFKNAHSNFDEWISFSQKEPCCNQSLHSSTSEKFLHFRQERIVKLLCFFFKFVILDYPYKKCAINNHLTSAEILKVPFSMCQRPGSDCWKHG